MKNAKLLLINTSILTFSGLILRTVSVSFNVYLTNKIGSAGMGLFQLIMTVYGLTVTFASSGIKLGATRLVTDALNSENKEVQSIIKMCFKYAFTVGLSSFILLYITSGLISEKWIVDNRAENSLKLLALSLPPISISSALNGYFTARRNMLKYSSVQLAEQIAKILLTVSALNFFGNSGIESACFAVAFGITGSEIASALCSYILYRTDSKNISYTKANEVNLKSLLRISVPDAIGASFRSVLLTVEHLLIPRGFKKSGQSAEQSISIYGMIHGIALPIVLYPSAIMTSLASLLVPELSKYKLLRDDKKISLISAASLKLSLIFSIGVGCFIFFFADIIASAIYNDITSAYYIKLFSVLVPIMYSDMITDGLLKGLDCQAASMKYNIFDSATCVLLVYFILPKYAIKGYIFILFISEIINFALSINRLSKETELKFYIVYDILRPIIFGAGGCSVVNMLSKYTLSVALAAKPALIINAVIFGLIYFCSIYFSNNRKKELKSHNYAIKNKSYA